MRILLSLAALLILATAHLSAQTPVTATVEVVVTDMDGKARSAEKIIFTSETNKKVYSGISDKDGSFLLILPAGDKYRIDISAIGDDQEYSSFEIPSLGPGESFSGNIVITIQFEPARLFTLDNVHFNTGKSTLRPDSYKELNELYEYLSLKKEVRIEIAGHTDDEGEEADNLKLSADRAAAVKAYLVKKGISPQRIETIGYGETRPIADNSSPEGRQKNRRTEVRILTE